MRLKNTLSAKRNFRNNVSAYLFLAPVLIGFTMFIAIPVILTFVLSFFDYNLLQPAQYIGASNFIKFFKDKNNLQIFLNTFKFLILYVPLYCVLGLVLAYLVFRVRSTRLRDLFRGIFYFPVIVTTASVAIAFTYMFSTNNGFINYYIRLLGFENVNWLTDSSIVYFTLAIFSVWKFLGSHFLYYFIGLNGIPESYYEAAKIDGASSIQIFRKITIPLLTPTIFFVMVTTAIGVFQIFVEPYFITEGGPGISTKTVVMQIHQTAFQEGNIGYGSTLALMLFILILIVTVIQYLLQNKWVGYDYE